MELIGKGIAILLAIMLILTIVWGWIMNIVTLIGGGYESMVTTVVGFIGIFVAFVGPLVYYIAG